ncbi:MAG: hypothetical protein FJ125_06500, partial [Deltaproteobacteria bacterium]|nr:hypothetical protein [Deltaproteobacteria bacterium]
MKTDGPTISSSMLRRGGAAVLARAGAHARTHARNLARLAALLAVLAVTGGAGGGCSETPPLQELQGPSTIAVRLADGERTGCGKGEQLLPYEIRWVKVRMSFELQDAAGERVSSYDGRIRLTMLPGEVDSSYLQLKEGLLEDVPIGIRQGFGHETRLWVETIDEGGGNVAGVSPRFCFTNPRLRHTQDSDLSYRSPLEKKQVLIDQGTLLVTGFSQTGFYVSDLSGCRVRPDWAEGQGRSRLDCLSEQRRVELTLTGTRPGEFRAPERIPGTPITVRPADAPNRWYEEGESYTVQENGWVVGIVRREEGAIPDGARVIVEYQGNALTFNSLYVYTYSVPFGVTPGTRVCSMQGGMTEFLGLTELCFPSYRIFLKGGAAAAAELRERPYNDEQVPDPRDDESYLFQECALDNPDWQGPEFVPDPIPIPAADIPGAEVPIFSSSDASFNLRHMKLDPYESALVRLEHVRLPTNWMSCDLDGSRMVDRCYDRDREEGRCLANQMAENDCEMACATAGLVGLRPGQRKADFASCTEVTSFASYGQYVVEVDDRRADGTVTATARINLNTR